MANRRRASKIVFIIFAVVGATILGVGALVFVRSLALVATGERAEGVVVRNVLGSGRRPVYHPVVRFEAREARVITPANRRSPSTTGKRR